MATCAAKPHTCAALQVQDHWTVVARSMSAVQELAVFSTLDKDELKQCLDRATNSNAAVAAVNQAQQSVA